jgi:hypothetical protein
MCPFACGLWYKLYKWFGFSSVVHPDPFVFTGCLAAGHGKGLKGLLTVWHAMMWTIWRARNEFIFSSEVPLLEECLDTIKRISWKWLVGKKGWYMY